MYISIVLPSFNMGKYIVQCLSTLVNQVDVNQDDYEVIIINDGSTDSTQPLAESFILSHNNHNISIINKENEGVSIARNMGLSEARGEYVWFVDPDDLIANDSIFHIKNAILTYNSPLFVIGEVIRGVLNADGSYNKHHLPKRESSAFMMVPPYELLSLERGFNHQRFIWKRDFLIKNRLHYPEYFTQNEDFFFLIKCLLNSNIAYVNDTFQFYYYRSDIESASRVRDNKERAIKFMRNRLMLLTELVKIENNSTLLNNANRFYFHLKLNQLQANSTVTLLYSCAPLYVVYFYLRQLKAQKCYPMTAEMISVAGYYYKIFNVKLVYLIVSQLFRLSFVRCFLRRIK